MIKKILLSCLRAYQFFISPLKPHTCRYAPTCSAYARAVLQSHPPGAAIKLIFRRVISCHPWGGYGYDPPPQPTHKSFSQS